MYCSPIHNKEQNILLAHSLSDKHTQIHLHLYTAVGQLKHPWFSGPIKTFLGHRNPGETDTTPAGMFLFGIF